MIWMALSACAMNAFGIGRLAGELQQTREKLRKLDNAIGTVSMHQYQQDYEIVSLRFRCRHGQEADHVE